jgi:hypothetical protein
MTGLVGLAVEAVRGERVSVLGVLVFWVARYHRQGNKLAASRYRAERGGAAQHKCQTTSQTPRPAHWSDRVRDAAHPVAAAEQR